MLLSLGRARTLFVLLLAVALGGPGIVAEAQDAADAGPAPKSVRGTLVSVRTGINTLVIKSDDGKNLSWRFEKAVIDEAVKFEEGAPVIVIYRQLPDGLKRVTALAFPDVEKTPIYVNLTGDRVVVRSAPRVNGSCDEAGAAGVTETTVPRGGKAEVLEGCWCCAVAGQSCPTTTQSGLGRAYLVQCFE